MRLPAAPTSTLSCSYDRTCCDAFQCIACGPYALSNFLLLALAKMRIVCSTSIHMINCLNGRISLTVSVFLYSEQTRCVFFLQSIDTFIRKIRRVFSSAARVYDIDHDKCYGLHNRLNETVYVIRQELSSNTTF